MNFLELNPDFSTTNVLIGTGVVAVAAGAFIISAWKKDDHWEIESLTKFNFEIAAENFCPDARLHHLKQLNSMFYWCMSLDQIPGFSYSPECFFFILVIRDILYELSVTGIESHNFVALKGPRLDALLKFAEKVYFLDKSSPIVQKQVIVLITKIFKEAYQFF